MIGEASVIQVKYPALKGVFLAVFIGVLFLTAAFFTMKVAPEDGISKDLMVADFRTDVNILTEALYNIESKRHGTSNSSRNTFGTTGKLLKSNEINKNLKGVLIKTAGTDNESLDNAILILGIMSLDTESYNEELKSLQYLSYDRNLGHYVVITKGKFAGTVLYNGSIKFIDSRKRCYFGIDVFEQL